MPAREPDPRLVGSDRVLAVLAELARHPDGIGLDEMSRVVDSPKPTVHRALASLRRAGFARQDGHGRYVLGDELLRLAFTNHEARPEHLRVQGALQALCDAFGETVHYAVLDDAHVVYRAKIDPPVGAMKLTSTIGGRNPAHCTAVGKLLLSYALPDDVAVRAWLSGRPLQRRTSHTLVTARAVAASLTQARSDGYAVDDQENELGINCLAVPVWLTSARVPVGAISVSALAHRTPLSELVDRVDLIRSIVEIHL
ncbi:IclR family transcriptional regulator [Acidothermaceae bacterium B102]|nr:IclR family transcriptional regulator [Acidothermaceae bacterium B102]